MDRPAPLRPSCPELLPASGLKALQVSCGLPARVTRVQDIAVCPEESQQLAAQLYSRSYIEGVVGGAPGQYRARILRIELVVLAMLLFVIGRTSSLLQLIDRLAQGLCPGLPVVEVSATAFYKRLEAVSHEVFLALLRDTTRSLESSPYQRLWLARLAPFATRISPLTTRRWRPWPGRWKS